MKIAAFFESIILTITIFFGSVFNLPDKNVQKLIDTNDGFIYGVCHPNENYTMLEKAGLKWVRFDIPCPYDKDGNIRNAYNQFKARCKDYTDRGFKVMAVTPYPRDLIADMQLQEHPVANEANITMTKNMAVFLYNDLKDITAAFQITNEMGLVGFMTPLTIEEAAVYIGVQLEAISEAKKANNDYFPIGYNSADLIQVSLRLHELMEPYYQYCDYVGIDLYTGNQGDATANDYIKKIKKLYRITKKPIIIEEFGFWSEGGPKTDEEKAKILLKYGYSSEAQAISDGMDFVKRLPAEFQRTLSVEYPDQEEKWAEYVFSKYSNHFYGITSAKTIQNIPHTPEGQAEYYSYLLPKLRKLNCLAGMIIYCCQDMEKCFACGHTWCPYETKWGLFYIDGTPKPSYYAVKEIITGTK